MARLLLKESGQQDTQRVLLGDLEAPSVTLLGPLDGDSDEGLGLDPGQPKPMLAIIYPGT